MNDERFDVVIHFPDGTYLVERSNLPAEDAILLAKECTQRPAVALGIIVKVQVVALLDDATVFLWERGKVIFPTREDIAKS